MRLFPADTELHFCGRCHVGGVLFGICDGSASPSPSGDGDREETKDMEQNEVREEEKGKKSTIGEKNNVNTGSRN